MSAARTHYSLTDEAWASHVEYASQALDAAIAANQESIAQYAQNVNGAIIWDAQRFAQQEAVIAILRARVAHVPSEGLAMILGGLGGSGKGAIQRHSADPLNIHAYAVVDPDEIKKLFAEFDMIPHVPGLSPMEASPLVHEEASAVAKRFAQALMSERRNILWDITMASESSVRDRISALRDYGYSQIDGVFIDSDFHRAYARAQRRHRKGQESYMSGQGFGGRIVPMFAAEKNRPTQPGFQSRNAQVFHALHDEFDNSVVFDVNVTPRVSSVTGQRFAELRGF